MLYTQTLDPATLELLKELMQIPELSEFLLVGWTNLALRYGHRKSVDLDLFSEQPFDVLKIERALIEKHPSVEIIKQQNDTLLCFINGIKVDIILYPYPSLFPYEDREGIRLMSVEDVICMKLSALSTRYSKKDFRDIAELLNHYTISQMMDWYKKKHPNIDPFHILNSFVYFDLAEESQEEVLSLNNISWDEVKSKITKAVEIYADTLFPDKP